MVFGKLKAAIVTSIVLAFILAFYTFGDSTVFTITGAAVTNLNTEGPADRVKETQITIDGNLIILNLPDTTIGRFEDTNSMSPVLDKGSSAILQKPTQTGLKVGDIISYDSKQANGLVTHRIVEISTDEHGWYALAKGDNSKNVDPNKIRFTQTKYVVVGILY